MAVAASRRCLAELYCTDSFLVLAIVKGRRLKLCRAVYECFVGKHILLILLILFDRNVIIDEDL